LERERLVGIVEIDVEKIAEPTDGENGSAVGECVECVAHAATTTNAQSAEPGRQHRLGHRSEVVERGDAVVVDPLVCAYRDAGRNVSNRAGDRRNHDVVQSGYGLVT
jgi:hypothetical protein